MGQFTPRAEDPTEWAGLPAEPMDRSSAADALSTSSVSADSLGLPGLDLRSVVVQLDGDDAADGTDGGKDAAVGDAKTGDE